MEAKCSQNTNKDNLQKRKENQPIIALYSAMQLFPLKSTFACLCILKTIQMPV